MFVCVVSAAAVYQRRVSQDKDKHVCHDYEISTDLQAWWCLPGQSVVVIDLDNYCDGFQLVNRSNYCTSYIQAYTMYAKDVLRVIQSYSRPPFSQLQFPIIFKLVTRDLLVI